MKWRKTVVSISKHEMQVYLEQPELDYSRRKLNNQSAE